MKNMFKYAAAAVILSASLVSCELDNYCLLYTSDAADE